MNKVEILENGNIKITIPMSFRSCAGRKRIVTPDSETSFTDPMITNIARAFRWQTLICSGRWQSSRILIEIYFHFHRKNSQKFSFSFLHDLSEVCFG